MKDVRREMVRSVHSFAALSDALLDELAEIAIERAERAKSVIFLEGEPAPGLYAVISGRVRVYRIARSGREQVMTVIGPGQLFNNVPVFDEGACPANAQMMDAGQLLLFPTDATRRLVSQRPALALLFLKETSGFMRRLVNLVDELALHTVQGRLARLLLDAAPDTLASGAQTQSEIAAQLGTVREMVGRSLRVFELQGHIRLEKGGIKVLDREALRAQADA